MGHNDHIDLELHEAVEDLLMAGEIEKGSKEYGVAQKVITDGIDSLSPKQWVVYEKGVIALLRIRAEELRLQEIIMSNPD